MIQNIYNKILFFILILFILMISACKEVVVPPEQQTWIKDNTTLFSQHGLWMFTYHGDMTIVPHIAAGKYIPPNTPVKLVEVLNARNYIVEVDNIQVMFKFAQRDVYVPQSKYFETVFSEKKMDTSHINELYANSLNDGSIQLGMSKEDVLLLRGQPSKKFVSSIENNEWIYKQYKHTTFILRFIDGKLIDILK